MWLEGNENLKIRSTKCLIVFAFGYATSFKPLSGSALDEDSL